jgi:hypothetical protein
MPPFRLLDPDALSLVAAHLDPTVDAYPAKLTCRALRDAVRTHHGARTRTDAVTMATTSVQRLQWAWRWAVPVSEAAAFDAALRAGRTAVARFLVRHGCATVTTYACELAAWHGHADTARWAKGQLAAADQAEELAEIVQRVTEGEGRDKHYRQLLATRHSPHPELVERVGLEACTYGNLEALKLACELGLHLDREHVYQACDRGHVEVSQYLRQHIEVDETCWSPEPYCGDAWRPLYEWLHGLGVHWNTSDNGTLGGLAAAYKHAGADLREFRSIVRWGLGRGYLDDDSVFCLCYELATQGDLETFQFLKRLGIQMGGHLRRHITSSNDWVDIPAAAAEFGHLEVLWWTLSQGFPADPRVCIKLAKRGEVAPLQLARAFGCPWDARVTATAAEVGNVEVLRWLWENGCPRDERVLELATRLHRMEVLTWAAARGFPWNAAARERLKTRQALREWAAQYLREAPRSTKPRRA